MYAVSYALPSAPPFWHQLSKELDKEARKIQKWYNKQTVYEIQFASLRYSTTEYALSLCMHTLVLGQIYVVTEYKHMLK